jgi:adenosyl cobinamide kinase/adenosyl cobinamide phosphate guanylyltransferase
VITLVLGGARSGKSAVAEGLAGAAAVYVATGEVTDDDMAARVAAHRARRPAGWRTVETADLPDVLGAHPADVVLIDSLGTWLTRYHDFAADVDALIGGLRAHAGPVIVVSEEVGMGVHPETALGRAFRDALGTVNQRVAEVADEVLLVVAGRTLRL